MTKTDQNNPPYSDNDIRLESCGKALHNLKMKIDGMAMVGAVPKEANALVRECVDATLETICAVLSDRKNEVKPLIISVTKERADSVFGSLCRIDAADKANVELEPSSWEEHEAQNGGEVKP